MDKRYVLAVVAAGLVIGLYVASPYWAVHRARSAIAARDPDALDRYVDFPAVRESLKNQFAAQVAEKSSHDDRLKDNPFAPFAQAFAASLAGTMIDSLVTPDGLARLANGGAKDAEEPFEASKYKTFDEQLRAAAKRNCAEALVADAERGIGPYKTFDAVYAAVIEARCPPAEVVTRYKGLDTFLVEVSSSGKRDGPVVLVFRRTGLFGWKMTSVRLPL